MQMAYPTPKDYFHHYCPLKSQVHYYSWHPSVDHRCLKPKFLQLVIRLIGWSLLSLPTPSFSFAFYTWTQETARKFDPWTSNISITCKHVRTLNSQATLLPGDSDAHYSFKTTAPAFLNCLQTPKSALLPLCKCSCLPTVFFYLTPSEVPYSPCFLLIFQVLA